MQRTRDRVRLQNQMVFAAGDAEQAVRGRQQSAGRQRASYPAGFWPKLRPILRNECGARWGDERPPCTEEQLVDALTGRAQPMHGEMLA